MGCCWAGVGDEGGGRGCQVLDGGCGGSMQLVLGDFFLLLELPKHFSDNF